MTALIERLRSWRKKLGDVGGYTNRLRAIPADGVAKVIEDAEEAAARIEKLERALEAIDGYWLSYFNCSPEDATYLMSPDIRKLWLQARAALANLKAGVRDEQK